MQHKVVEDLIQLIFKVVDEYRCGKAGAYFQSRAADIEHLKLTNKKRDHEVCMKFSQRLPSLSQESTNSARPYV